MILVERQKPQERQRLILRQCHCVEIEMEMMLSGRQIGIFDSASENSKEGDRRLAPINAIELISLGRFWIDCGPSSAWYADLSRRRCKTRKNATCETIKLRELFVNRILSLTGSRYPREQLKRFDGCRRRLYPCPSLCPLPKILSIAALSLSFFLDVVWL